MREKKIELCADYYTAAEFQTGSKYVMCSGGTWRDPSALSMMTHRDICISWQIMPILGTQKGQVHIQGCKPIAVHWGFPGGVSQRPLDLNFHCTSFPSIGHNFLNILFSVVRGTKSCTDLGNTCWGTGYCHLGGRASKGPHGNKNVIDAELVQWGAPTYSWRFQKGLV